MADLRKVHRVLLDHALSYPGAYEDHPWEDDLVTKVNKKIFVFFGSPAKDSVGIAVKLPVEGEYARSLPFCEPSGYGLGKWGWVNARFGPDDDIPVDTLKEWIDESYRAIAPKKLVKELDAPFAPRTPSKGTG
jgi:predicted DNA-binding protein (MmcQ/YjbR family)